MWWRIWVPIAKVWRIFKVSWEEEGAVKHSLEEFHRDWTLSKNSDSAIVFKGVWLSFFLDDSISKLSKNQQVKFHSKIILSHFAFTPKKKLSRFIVHKTFASSSHHSFELLHKALKLKSILEKKNFICWFWQSYLVRWFFLINFIKTIAWFHPFCTHVWTAILKSI